MEQSLIFFIEEVEECSKQDEMQAKSNSEKDNILSAGGEYFIKSHKCPEIRDDTKDIFEIIVDEKCKQREKKDSPSILKTAKACTLLLATIFAISPMVGVKSASNSSYGEIINKIDIDKTSEDGKRRI